MPKIVAGLFGIVFLLNALVFILDAKTLQVGSAVENLYTWAGIVSGVLGIVAFVYCFGG